MLAKSSDLAALLSQPEGQRLAFVRRAFRVDELAETLAALANAHGGSIVVGVSGRSKKIEGVADVESARLAALDAALDGNTLVLRISDNGIGVPAASAGAIFELFAQAQHVPDRVQDGLGIGLSLVRKLV